jgi:hypothetical protein
VEVHSCTFDKRLSQGALGAVLRAIIRRRGGFDAVVEADHLVPAPSLLPAALVRQGHLLFGWWC